MSQFVLDASVALAWCFPDEAESNLVAEKVIERLLRGDTAVATSFWPHEILNALLVGEKRKRITKALIQSFLDDLTALPVTLVSSSADAVFTRIHSLARELDLTAYDAAYLAIALDSALPLATLDAALIRACKKAGVDLLE